MRARNRILFEIFSLTLTCCILTMMGGCGSKPVSSEKPSPVTFKKPNVKTIVLGPRTINDYLELTGNSEPWKHVTVAAQSGGVVEKIYFEKGDDVQKGDRLADIDSELQDAQYSEAKANYDLQESNYQRAQKLYAANAITERDYNSAVAAFESARARLKQAKVALDRSRVDAPISGIIVEKYFELGEFAPPGAGIADIEQMDKIKISVGIPEKDIIYFEEGEKVEIIFDMLEEGVFEGEITYVSPSADERSHTFPLELKLDNPDGVIRTGLIARVKLLRKQYEDAVVIPQTSIVERADKNVVFIVEEGKAKLREIKIEVTADGQALIAEGLEFGDRLIVSGQRDLVDEESINVASEIQQKTEE